MDQTVDVALTPGGSVDIGRPPTGPGAHFFPVFGAQVGVDVADSRSVPYASVVDVSKASWWLSLVYGEELASEVAKLGSAADESGEDDEPRRSVSVVEVHNGPLREPLVRYGVGTWIQQWWPTSDVAPHVRIDEALLDLEVGVLAWAIEFVLGGTEVARSHLEHRVSYVLATLDDGAPDSALFEPVVRAILECVPMTDAQYDVLRSQEERLEDVAAAMASMDDSMIQQWYLTQGLASSPLTAAGIVTMGGTAERTFAVDVEQVPPRSVSWGEDAIEVFAAQVGTRLEVEVVVNAGDLVTELPLWARIYVGTDLLPVAVVALVRDGPTYTGRADVEDTPLPEDFFVDVFTPSLMAAPDPARAARLRAAVAPVYERLRITSARTRPGDEHVQDLPAEAPWRGLIPGALLRG